MNGEALGRLMKVATEPAVIAGENTNGLVFTRGDTVPTDATAGYAKGCIFVNTDGTDHSDLLYTNIGTAASCNFNLITVASD